MNAILREYEAPVLTNDAIEVHLSYLGAAVEGLAQKLDQVSKDSVARDEGLAQKLDQVSKDSVARDEGLAQKLDQVSKDSVARDELLARKIDKTNEKVENINQNLIERTSKIQGSIDGLKWFTASVALILSGLSIAHTLTWI